MMGILLSTPSTFRAMRPCGASVLEPSALDLFALPRLIPLDSLLVNYGCDKEAGCLVSSVGLGNVPPHWTRTDIVLG